MTSDLNGQQPRPVVAGELRQLFQPKVFPRLRETLRLRRYMVFPSPTRDNVRERSLWRRDANARNVVEADLQISFPRHRDWLLLAGSCLPPESNSTRWNGRWTP